MKLKNTSVLGALGIGSPFSGVLGAITGGNPMLGAIGSIITGGGAGDNQIKPKEPEKEPPYRKLPLRDRSELLIGGSWIRPSGSGPMTDAEYLEGRRIIDSMPTGPAKELRQIRLFQQFLRSTV